MELTVNVQDKDGVALAALGISISINGVVTPDVNTTTATITNDTYVNVEISKTGYITYTNTIRVFEKNETITVRLVDVISDITNPNYKRPYPYFFAIHDPCSFNVYVYKGSSSQGDHFYFLDNVLYAEGNNAIIEVHQAGDYQIKQRVVGRSSTNAIIWDKFYATSITGEITNSLEDNLALDVTTNTTVEEFKPSLSLAVTQSRYCTEDENSISDTSITVTPDVVINTKSGNTCTTATLAYKLYDIDNLLVTEVSHTLTPAALPAPSAIALTFTPAKIGDYRVEAELTNCCVTTYLKKVVEVCNFIKFKRSTVCTDYTVTNCSLEKTITVTVYDLNSNVYIAAQTVLPGQSTTLQFAVDGVYKVLVAYTASDGSAKEEWYVQHSFCNLENCYASFVNKLICLEDEDGSCCDSCKSAIKEIQFDLQRLFATGFTYFMHLEAEYGFNNVYTALDATKLAELTEVNDLAAKITKYCKSVGCGGDCCSGC